jgi:hypothetical protein
MYEKFEIHGKWWLPDNEDEKIQGTLYFNPGDKIILELYGLFNKNKNGRGLIKSDFIHGITNIKGKKVTLNTCLEMNREFGPIGESKFDIFFVFIGKHYFCLNEIQIDKIIVEYSFLNQWLDRKGIIKIDKNNNKLNIEYKIPDVIKIYNDDAVNIEINFIVNYPVSSPISGKPFFHLEECSFFNISFSNKKNILKCKEIIEAISDFINLAMRRYIFPIKITFFDDSIGVDYYYILPNIYNPYKPIHSLDIFLPFDLLKNNISIYFSNWIKKIEELKTIRELYFGVYANPIKNIITTFLNFTQVMESYHMIFVGNEENKLRDIIGYVINLFKDLTVLNLEQLQLNDELINDIVNSRNYFIHHDIKKKEKCLKYKKLYEVNQILDFIICILFLKEMGFEENDIRKIVNNYLKNNEIVEMELSGPFLDK